MRLVALPRTVDTRRCWRWSHLAASLLQVASATFLGATTRTLATCQRKYLRMLTADRVMTVLPSPGRRNSPTVGSPTTRWMQ